jgi:hypothetical protein
MSRIIKDKHLQIDYDIAEEITKRSNEKGCSEVEEYNKLLRYSLEFEKIFEKLNIMLKVLDKASENTYYIRSLLCQTYCDLNLPIRDIKISNNLSEFNKNYHNKKKRLNE